MNRLKTIGKSVTLLAFWVGILLAIRHFVGIITIVSGESMYPTLEDGQCIIGVSTYIEAPEKNDIVLLKQDGEILVKRIFAVSGETVVESYPDGKRYLKLEENQYYVLGDNIANSRDSRTFGPVDGDNINHVVKVTNNWYAIGIAVLFVAVYLFLAWRSTYLVKPKEPEEHDTEIKENHTETEENIEA